MLYQNARDSDGLILILHFYAQREGHLSLKYFGMFKTNNSTALKKIMVGSRGLFSRLLGLLPLEFSAIIAQTEDKLLGNRVMTSTN